MKDPATWQKGQLVMIPFWGLSEVWGHSRETLLGKEYDFCLIRPKRLDEPIKYTHQTIRELGIRALMTPLQLESLLQQPDQPEKLLRMPGTRRYQRWTRLLRSGRAGARCKILGEMAVLDHQGVPLMTREKDLRQTIESNFRAEVREVLACSPEKAARFVKAVCQ